MRKPLIRSWNPGEDQLLREMLAQKQPVRLIARKLKRSLSSVRARMVLHDLHTLPGTPTINDLRRVMREGALAR
jgi:hypothetical protein